MPELPEVEALRRFLAPRLVGRAIAGVHLTAFTALKSVHPPLDALLGLPVEAVNRHGKHLDVEAQGLHLVFHLGRAGWLVWHEPAPRRSRPAAPPRPGRGPLALRVLLDDDAGFDLTEAGTQRRLTIELTDDVRSVERIAALGPDPLAPNFTPEVLDAILERAGASRLKGVLRDQRALAGIGNAWSDEILFAARMSPHQPASGLDAAGRARLYDAIRVTLGDAVQRLEGLEPRDLKDAKRSAMAVHGRTGEPCPVCGTPVAEVSFADSSLQYCPHCQTGGHVLADRRLSRLLR